MLARLPQFTVASNSTSGSAPIRRSKGANSPMLVHSMQAKQCSSCGSRNGGAGNTLSRRPCPISACPLPRTDTPCQNLTACTSNSARHLSFHSFSEVNFRTSPSRLGPLQLCSSLAASVTDCFNWTTSRGAASFSVRLQKNNERENFLQV